MIERDDIIKIDRSYFEIVEIKDFVIVIRSRNTGHYWCLQEQMPNNSRSFLISHKHHQSNPYHRQKNRPTVEACCEYIRSHDFYQMEKDRRKEKNRMCRQIEKHGNKALPG